MRIRFHVHSTSVDNENGVASGHHDAPLSPLGLEQVNKVKCSALGSIYASTLSRSIETAEIIFPNATIHQDERLCEIDYGDLTRVHKSKIEAVRKDHIERIYPNGESYQAVEKRVREFLLEHAKLDSLTIVSHQAPQLALEVICNHKAWEEAFESDWRNNGKWQPHWEYNI